MLHRKHIVGIGILAAIFVVVTCGCQGNRGYSAILNAEYLPELIDREKLNTQTLTSSEAQASCGQTLTKETLYDYEIKTAEDGGRYVSLRGIHEKYRENLMENLNDLGIKYYDLIPETLEDLPVREIAEGAFKNTDLKEIGRCEYVQIMIPSPVSVLAQSCFENCGIDCVMFEKEEGEKGVSHPVTIADRAFAGNPDLWGVLLNTENTSLGEAVFDGCTKIPYLCCIFGTKENKERMDQSAQENGAAMVEIPAYYSDSPLVQYPETPLVLMPEIKTFFYGENTPGEMFDETYLEYDDNASDFGFPELHLFCGEVCCISGETNINASSTLPSDNDRYTVHNLYNTDRTVAWAEGVEGYGIGESVSITEEIYIPFEREQYGEGYIWLLEGDMEPDIFDGYARYIQVCVVNGYAKNQQLYEENGRVKRLLMYVEDKPYAYLEIEDTIYPQYFNLPINDIKAAFGVKVDFRFEILEVYPGTKYEDTCLTGLMMEYMGRKGH